MTAFRESLRADAPLKNDKDKEKKNQENIRAFNHISQCIQVDKPPLALP